MLGGDCHEEREPPQILANDGIGDALQLQCTAVLFLVCRLFPVKGQEAGGTGRDAVTLDLGHQLPLVVKQVEVAVIVCQDSLHQVLHRLLLNQKDSKPG